MNRVTVPTDRKSMPCPPNQLGQPKKTFAETFSAIIAIKQRFGMKG